MAEEHLLLYGGRDGAMISCAHSVSDGPSPLTEEGAHVVEGQLQWHLEGLTGNALLLTVFCSF